MVTVPDTEARAGLLRRIWRRYAHIGDPALDAQHARGVLVMAAFAPIGALSVLGYAAFYVFLDPAHLCPAIVLNALAGVFFLSCHTVGDRA